MELKNSETLQNLMRAFAGESQARNRYTFAAEVCRQQKLQVLEAVFLFTAGQEKEHAEIFYNHMREITGGSVQIDGGYPVALTHDVAELLRSAQRHEYEEHDPVYKSFGETARQEGFGSGLLPADRRHRTAPRQPLRGLCRPAGERKAVRFGCSVRLDVPQLRPCLYRHGGPPALPGMSA